MKHLNPNDYAKVHDQGRSLLPKCEKIHNFLKNFSIFTNDVLFEAKNTTEKENVSIEGQKNLGGAFGASES